MHGNQSKHNENCIFYLFTFDAYLKTVIFLKIKFVDLLISNTFNFQPKQKKTSQPINKLFDENCMHASIRSPYYFISLDTLIVFSVSSYLSSVQNVIHIYVVYFVW